MLCFVIYATVTHIAEKRSRAGDLQCTDPLVFDYAPIQYSSAREFRSQALEIEQSTLLSAKWRITIEIPAATSIIPNTLAQKLIFSFMTCQICSYDWQTV